MAESNDFERFVDQVQMMGISIDLLQAGMQSLGNAVTSLRQTVEARLDKLQTTLDKVETQLSDLMVQQNRMQYQISTHADLLIRLREEIERQRPPESPLI